MSELEQLLNEKRKLEDRIRALRQGVTNYGQLDNIRYCYRKDRDDDRGWQVSTLMVQRSTRRESRMDADAKGHKYREQIIDREVPRWQVFIREKTKKEALAKIRVIIGDLAQLIDTWEKEDDEQ